MWYSPDHDIADGDITPSAHSPHPKLKISGEAKRMLEKMMAKLNETVRAEMQKEY